MFKLTNEALWRQWAPLPLRLVIGYGFMAHGWAKLSRGPEGFAKLLEQKCTGRAGGIVPGSVGQLAWSTSRSRLAETSGAPAASKESVRKALKSPRNQGKCGVLAQTLRDLENRPLSPADSTEERPSDPHTRVR
jgi:hypothetical protein